MLHLTPNVVMKMNCKGMLSYMKEKYYDNMGRNLELIAHACNVFCPERNISMIIQIFSSG